MKKLIFILILVGAICARAHDRDIHPPENRKYYRPATTLAHNLLSTTHSDTTTDSPTRGSLVFGNSTPAWDELAISSSIGTTLTKVLGTDGTDSGFRTLANFADDIEGEIDHGGLAGLLDDVHPYLSLDGEGTNVTNGTFDLITTGSGRFDGGIGYEVVAGANFPVEVVVDGYGIMQTFNGIEMGFYTSEHGWLGTKSNHNLYLFTNNSNPEVTVEAGGKVAIGDNFKNPSTRLHVRDTATQLRLDYDVSNYVDFAVQSDGDVNLSSNKAGYDIDLGDGNVRTTGNMSATSFIAGGTILTDNSLATDAADILSIHPDSVGDGTSLPFGSGIGVKFFGNTDSDDENPALAVYGYAKSAGPAQKYGAIYIDDFGRLVFGGTATGTLFNNTLTIADLILMSGTRAGYLFRNTNSSNAPSGHITFGAGREAGATGNESIWVMTRYARRALDFDVPSTEYSQLWVHDGSATVGNVVKLYHDANDGIIATGSGDIQLLPDSGFVGINKAPTVALDVNGAALIGDGTNEVSISSTGDFNFKGGAGLIFGSCRGMEIGWIQANAVQNTWYDINDVDMVDEQLHGITHDGEGRLTVTEPGMYASDWAGAFEADAANLHIQITFSINGTEGDAGMNHFETVAVSREYAVSGFAILDLADNDTVGVSIRTTDAGAPDLLVDHLLIRLVQIGGT